MTADLFLAASGVSLATLARVAPPSCLCPVEQPTPVVRRAGGDTVIECGPWTPRVGASYLLPSFSAPAVAPPAFRCELSARAGGAWSPWVATVTIGEAAFPALPSTAGPLTVDVDEVQASHAVDAIRLRVRCRGPLPGVWLASLCVAGGAGLEAGTPPGAGARIDVPALSQMAEDRTIAMRICSPTSVAMVLRYWGRDATAAAVAADAFHRETDRYGIWPAAIRAAAARGVAGYLLRFPDWSAAAWCLARGLPIIASIRYDDGELDGAPMPSTTGHLVVLTGYEDGVVLVNDPAGASPAAVPRRYRRDQLTRAWLARKGVGYILFDPTRV